MPAWLLKSAKTAATSKKNNHHSWMMELEEDEPSWHAERTQLAPASSQASGCTVIEISTYSMLNVNKTTTLYTGCKVDRWSAAKTIHHGEVGKHRKGKRQGKKEWSVQNPAVARQPANLRCQIGLVSRFIISNSTKKRCTPFLNGKQIRCKVIYFKKRKKFVKSDLRSELQI
ncbi:hypothetical protein T4B_1644 [Trichinella pseudospiralis]|nr:hypothetical protein T4B_1644 [Trichinella pseudospiralis]